MQPADKPIEDLKGNVNAAEGAGETFCHFFLVTKKFVKANLLTVRAVGPKCPIVTFCTSMKLRQQPCYTCQVPKNQ